MLNSFCYKVKKKKEEKIDELALRLHARNCPYDWLWTTAAPEGQKRQDVGATEELATR